MAVQVKQKDKLALKDLMLWLFVFGIPIGVWFLPTSLDPIVQKYLAIALWAVLAWMTAIIPLEVTGIAVPCVLLFFNVVPAEVAFAPWSNTVVWSTTACILLGVAVDRSGIAKRMAYSILLKMDCSIKGLVWGFAVAGLLMAFIITDSFARALIFITIAVGICKALDIPYKSKEATALGLAAFFGMSGPSIGTLAGGNGIQINSVYRHVAGNIGYFEWLLHNFVPAIAWTLVSVFVTLKVLKIGKNRCLDAREELVARKTELGKISFREYTVLIALIFLVLDYVFAANFGLDPLLVAGLAIPFFFLPKIGILTIDDFDLADFKILFVMTGAMTIGSAATAVGLVEILMTQIMPIVGESSFMMVTGAFLLASFGNFFLTPLAIVFTFTEVFAQMAVDLGMNPLPVIYALNFGTDIYIFPYEYAILLLCFSFGIMDYKDTVKVLLWRCLGGLAIFFFIFIPFWKLLGIM